MATRIGTQNLAACAVLLALIVAGVSILRHLPSDAGEIVELASQ